MINSMSSSLITILKKVGLIGSILTALTLLGSSLNVLIPWDWLTYFFVIIRSLVYLFDFMNDTGTMLTIFGLWLSVSIAVWVFRSRFVIIRYLKN